MWNVHDPSDIFEVLSLRRAHITGAKILVAPQHDDRFAQLRPLLAFLEADSVSRVNIKFFSLRTSELLTQRLELRGNPIRIEANEHVVAVVLPDSVALFASSSLEPLTVISDCYVSAGPSLNPTAMSSRWLAYASAEPLAKNDLAGGVAQIPAPTNRIAAVVSMAQKTGSSLLTLSGKGVQRVSELLNGPAPGRAGPETVASVSSPAPGMVRVEAGAVKVVDTCAPFRTVAHFLAHHGLPLAQLAFDPTGLLLVTAGSEGQDFHVFSLATDGYTEAGSSRGTAEAAPWKLVPRHLYILRRGLTIASISHITFSFDSRWVAVTSSRGTTHVFPINPRGGAVTQRTHLSPRVLNASTFEMSAGIREIDGVRIQRALESVAKVKLHYDGTSSSFPGNHRDSISAAPPMAYGLVAACFGPIVSVAMRPEHSTHLNLTANRPRSARTYCLPLFICTSEGQLVEHRLFPYAQATQDAAMQRAQALDGILMGWSAEG